MPNIQETSSSKSLLTTLKQRFLTLPPNLFKYYFMEPDVDFVPPHSTINIHRRLFRIGILPFFSTTEEYNERVALARERFRDVPVPEIDSQTREAKGRERPVSGTIALNEQCVRLHQ